MRLFHRIEKLITMEGAAAKKGRRVTLEDLSVVEDAIVIENKGCIEWVGNRSDFKSVQKKYAKAEKISLNAKSVMPTFLECHTHSLFAGDRTNEFEMRNQGRSYQEITAAGGGIASTVKATRAMSDQDLIKLTKNRLQEFLSQGVSTVEIKSGYGLSEKQEIRLLEIIGKLKSFKKGFEVVATYLGPHSKSPDHADLDSYFEEILNSTLSKVAKKKLAERVDIFVEKGFFTPEQGEQFLKRSVELGFAITAHAEQLTRTGAAASFAAQKAVSVDHLVHISDADIVALAKSQTTCVLLPASDFYLKIDYPPARKLIENGACVSLSTDFNPGTSPTTDLSFVGVLARLHMKMSLPEVIAAWTIGAAYALNRQGVAGSLEVGKKCDFIVSDDEYAQFFYRVGHHPVRQVYLAGQLAFQR